MPSPLISNSAPLMNVLFWGRCAFHISFSGRDMSGNVSNRPSGSSMVDIGLSLNIMRSPSPKFYMTFWDMTIYSDTLHWSDISINRIFVTELDLITDFCFITKFWEVSKEHLQQMRLSNRGRLFGLMLRSLTTELAMFPYFVNFEHPSVLLFSFELYFINDLYNLHFGFNIFIRILYLQGHWFGSRIYWSHRSEGAECRRLLLFFYSIRRYERSSICLWKKKCEMHTPMADRKTTTATMLLSRIQSVAR